MSLSSLELDSKYIDSSIAELLRQRYEEGECYHQLGTKCFIAINPLHLLLRNSRAFKEDEYLLQKFVRKATVEELPKCHKYGFAQNIHIATAEEQTSQTVVFRGCSGSGKSELLKSVVQYLICADSKKKDVVQGLASLFPLGSAQNVLGVPSDSTRIGRVLSAGLLMYDTMGTIITPKNDHSTRTMKHIKLVYGSGGLLQGVRLVSLFTDLLRFNNAEAFDSPARMLLLVAAGLTGGRASEFKMHSTLQKSFLESCLGMNYYGGVEELSVEFCHVEHILLQSGALTPDEWTDCLKAFAACIHLLSVAIEGTDVAEITNATKLYISDAEDLLGLERNLLAILITQREDSRIGKSTGSLIDNKPAEAVVMLESLCRIIYGRTFKFCLYQCSVKSFVRNRQSIDRGGEYMAAIAGGADNRSELHLVDMPGWVTQFEAGATASSSGGVGGMVGHLHHLLQNYMEERMHEEYLHAVFAQELEIYHAEGVSLDGVVLPESEPFAEFFEKPTTGLISLLEEACQAIKPDDRTLVSKIMVTHLKTKLIKAGGARANATVFVIHHSFGDVNYDLDGFIVQNKHFYLQAAVLAAIESSTVHFVAHDVTLPGTEALPPPPNAAVAKIAKSSSALNNLLMTKSRDALQRLLVTLKQNQLTYALCISTAPTCKRTEKQAALFNKDHVVAQCKYFALSSRIALGQKGYPHIMQYRRFYDRYRPMLPFKIADLPMSLQSFGGDDEGLLDGEAMKTLCEAMMAHCVPYLLNDLSLGQALTASDVPKYGTSCIFLKDKLHKCLEQYRANYMRNSFLAAVKIRSNYLRFQMSRQYRQARRGTVLLQSKHRSTTCRATFLRFRYVLNKLKATFRMRVCRIAYCNLQRAVQVIKSKLLGKMIARLRFKQLQRALVTMRGLMRGYVVRHTAISTFSAIQRLQRSAKRFVTRMRRQKMMLQATHCIQRCLRGYQSRSKFRFVTKVLSIRRDQRIARKVVTILQARWRRQLVCRRFREVYRATLKIQTWWRSKLESMRYNKMQQLVLWLQSIARRVGAQNLSSSISAKIMVQQEFELLNEGLHREMASIAAIGDIHRILGSGYTRNESSKFDRLLLLFNLTFDLSFAYPNGWIKTIIDFCRSLREERKSVRKIAVGSQHTVVLDDLSNVYTMGLGDLGQLGHNNRVSYPQPRKIENLTQHLSSSAGAVPAVHKFNAVSQSPVHAMTSGGHLSRSLALAVEVKDVCCGKDHTLLLTSVGTVYSWGDNHRGQLGHSRYESSAIPRLVGTASSSSMQSPGKGSVHRQQLKYVRAICCGDFHSVCLADPGTVYTWGNGQCLGRPSLDAPVPNHSTLKSKGGKARADISINDSCEPDMLPFFSVGRHRVQQICSGENHIIVRSGCELFAWGLNHHGQLGDGTTTDRMQPVKIDLPPLSNELELLHAEIASGGRHNVLLYRGQIWSWGWNKYGQVGNDTVEDVLSPHVVKLTRSQSSRHYIRNINAGLRHTIVLTASLQLFGWGLLNFTTTSRSPAETDQLPALTPTVSFLPKNIDHFIPSTGADNLYLALAGSSSSSLSYVALDMCSTSGPPTHSRNEKKTTSNPAATRMIGKAVRSLSKSPTRTEKVTARNDAVVSVQRRATRQQFNTILYKVDKPTTNVSQNEEIIEKFKRIKSGKMDSTSYRPFYEATNSGGEEAIERSRSRSVSPSRPVIAQKATHKVTWKPSSPMPCRPFVNGGSPPTSKSIALVDLFSPKLLSSVKATRSSPDMDYGAGSKTSGSTIRENFVVLSGALNIASIQDQSHTMDRRPSNRNTNVSSSLGVGMPKIERAFLAAYAAKIGAGSSSPAKRKQSFSPSLQSEYEAGPSTKIDFDRGLDTGSKFPSFMSPTLSYYSKLAARRTSVDSTVNITPANTFRRPSNFASSGPLVRLPNARSLGSADPAEFLGLDTAIEKLQAALDNKLLLS